MADVFTDLSAEAFEKAPYLRNPPLRRSIFQNNQHVMVGQQQLFSESQGRSDHPSNTVLLLFSSKFQVVA